MNEAYELADGTLSTDYQVGDTFVLQESSGADDTGAVITCKEKCGNAFLYKYEHIVARWSWVIPTHETKMRVKRERLENNIAEYSGILSSVNREQVTSNEPLAKVVDWRNGEQVTDGDVLLHLSNDGDIKYVTGAEFLDLHLNRCPNSVVIRINKELLPKHEVISKAEAEIRFGVRIQD
jgi:hypothetical protein